MISTPNFATNLHRACLFTLTDLEYRPSSRETHMFAMSRHANDLNRACLFTAFSLEC